PAASTTRYAGCNCNGLLALPPSWLLVKLVKLLPAVRFPCLLSMPTAPTSSSSACEVVAGVPVHVVAVMPELGVVLFPVPVWQRVVVVLLPLFAVPMVACLMVLITVMLNGLEAAETAPIASVAFAVITCVPTLRGVVTLTPTVLLA